MRSPAGLGMPASGAAMRHDSRLSIGLMVIVPSMLAIGCAATRRTAVPDNLTELANVPGYPNDIRYFPRGTGDVEEFKQDYLDAGARERAFLESLGRTGPLPTASFLAVSGGGDNGAFGAGFLLGWTKSGTRPEFKLVTGISTGALIAPFAFLGPSHDDELRFLYTHITTRDIAVKRSLLSLFFDDAMADDAPLLELIEKHVTLSLLDAIALEHAKGRMLLVGTCNLDARRPVIWNMTKIAASGQPDRLDLFHKILLASAAIPGTFPPVMIPSEYDHHSFEEMHVDGGTAAQVFIYPAAIHLAELAREQGLERERRLYLIRNARLDPEWAEVDRRTLPILVRAITTLIQYQGIGDLYRIYAVAQRDGVDFNLAFIPRSFSAKRTEDFDADYMNQLFQFGVNSAQAGYDWYKEPPVLLSQP